MNFDFEVQRGGKRYEEILRGTKMVEMVVIEETESRGESGRPWAGLLSAFKTLALNGNLYSIQTSNN